MGPWLHSLSHMPTRAKPSLARELQRLYPLPAWMPDHIVSQVVRTGQANVLTEVPDWCWLIRPETATT